MTTVSYDTATARFNFEIEDVVKVLEHFSLKEKGGDSQELLEHLKAQSGGSILIPKEKSYFGYAVLDLLREGKGTVYCKPCDRAYEPKELVAVKVGAGESPLKVTAHYPGGWFNRIFRKRRRLPLFGGKGYECPKCHELIGMVTWRA